MQTDSKKHINPTDANNVLAVRASLPNNCTRLNWIFLWEMCDMDKLKEWSKKYTLTEKEGKYYTNW